MVIDLVPTDQPPGYPAQWETDSLLSDGTVVHLRPIRPADASELEAFHRTLSNQTIYYRYFGLHPDIAEETPHLTQLDYVFRMAFVALVAGDLIGVGRYEWENSGEPAELAFVVADAFHDRGVGTLLLEQLVAYGAERGIYRFVAEVLPENPTMLRVFQDSGLSVVQCNADGVVRVLIDPSSTPAYLDRRDEHERTAASASIAQLLRPGSIAVVGAGRTPGGVGHTILRHLLDSDFPGTIYPINPNARSVHGLRAFASLSDVPERLDLAVVAVRAEQVVTVARDAAIAGVGSLVVVSSGFAELGEAGKVAQRELLEISRRSGMRVVGPNCLGICNTAPEVRFNATFSPAVPVPGPIAIASQSGAVGIVILEQARLAGLGISSFVSVGNKIDVSGNDLLSYWETDDATRVIALYLESFGNPRKFGRIARRVSPQKPIVVLKAGKSAAGARGARSHTASAATPAAATSALLSGSGAIEVTSLDEMMDVVDVLVHCSLPAGQRVALVGNSGGPLILTADACAAEGLLVPELSPATQDELIALAPPASACGNPVDITADGGAAVFEAILERTLLDDLVDAAIVVVTSLISLSAEDALRVVETVACRTKKPIISCLLASGEDAAKLVVRERSSVVSAPERAAKALAKVARYALWRTETTDGQDDIVDLGLTKVREIVEAKLSKVPEGGWLDADAASELLRALGVRAVESVAVASADDAVAAAERVGFPAVLKAGSGAIVHKSDVGGVILDIATPAGMLQAFEEMTSRLGDSMLPATVQPMLDRGVETIVGMTADGSFGPLIMFGLGGVLTDLLGDRTFAIPPLSGAAADRLIGSIRCAPLLFGYRGSAPVDVASLRDILVRVATLSVEVPEIAELDFNPVIVSPTGAVVVDCKVRVERSQPGPDVLMRALRS